MNLIAIRTLLARVPGWLWVALAVVFACVLAALFVADRERRAVEADRSVSRGKVLERARDADERAHGAGERKSQEVEDANDRARRAANGSDDPLRDAFDSLRSETD